MTRASYTDQQKSDALAAYVEHGPSEAARQTGIPKGTIAAWARRNHVQTTAPQKAAATAEATAAYAKERREQLKRDLLDKAVQLLQRMDEPHQEFVGVKGNEVVYSRAPAAAVKAYATSVGILIDKLRLEEGAATSREEHVNVSEVDRELERLADELRSRTSSPPAMAEDGTS